MYFSIIYRAFFIVLISLVIPQTIFPQLDDIGITIQKNPGHTVRDSLDFFIIEGSSPIFDQNIEGAAINIAGVETDRSVGNPIGSLRYSKSDSTIWTL